MDELMRNLLEVIEGASPLMSQRPSPFVLSKKFA